MTTDDLQRIRRSADYVRYLSLESIERAKSGHPGMPLGCAELGVLLYRYILNYYPQDGSWFNRDRFILSAGHGSMLLYSLLHAVGYDISLKDIGDFRQLGSKTAGHPEYDIKDGIETTTGPLGQGFANAVGSAIEGKMLAQRFNTKDIDLFDYHVIALMGDGCMMEGISYEAASMAGHLGLDNLVAIYDSNHISIDGHTDITFNENVAQRFEAQGWLVEQAEIKDIRDVLQKLRHLKAAKGKPKLLIVKTIIGEGVKEKRDSANIHGAPAGIDEIAWFVQNSSIKESLFEKEWKKEEVNDTEKLKDLLKDRIENKKNHSLLPYPESLEFIREGVAGNKEDYDAWQKKFENYKNTYPEKYNELATYLEYGLPRELEQKLLNFSKAGKDATRGVSGTVLNLCAQYLPQMTGGCADLAGSTKAGIKDSTYLENGNFSGRNIAFGVREHAMGAIGNGMALNKVMIPFTSTFFTFFDYMKPPIRLAALMGLRHLFIFSHDSIYVGEDGPTHQPIEHLNALRMIPDLHVFRPGNDVETAFSYLYFLKELAGPAAVITTRQKLPAEMFNRPDKDRNELYADFCNGGYVFYETEAGVKPDIILTASGSELALAMETAGMLEEKENKKVRVVSIPCLELLNKKDQSYRDGLFPRGVKKVLVEAASYRSVDTFYSKNILVIDIQEFGKSAPGNKVAEYFGFTADKVFDKIKAWM